MTILDAQVFHFYHSLEFLNPPIKSQSGIFLSGCECFIGQVLSVCNILVFLLLTSSIKLQALTWGGSELEQGSPIPLSMDRHWSTVCQQLAHVNKQSPIQGMQAACKSCSLWSVEKPFSTEPVPAAQKLENMLSKGRFRNGCL